MRDSAGLSAYFAMCNFMQLMFMQLQRYKTEKQSYFICHSRNCTRKAGSNQQFKLGGGSNILLVLVCLLRQGTFQKSGMKM